MTIIDIGVKFNLEKLIESRMLIQANSGGGKSWATRKALEEVYGKVPFILFDTDGEYHTLREKFKDILIIGGKNADIKINIKSAELLPEQIVKHNISCIIDLSDLKQLERIQYIKKFLENLIELKSEFWKPYIIVVEEVHKYCGQQEKQDSTWAVIDLMTRGRKRGYCGWLITQRIAKLHKDASAEANNKLVGRTFQDIDRKRAAEELGFTTKEESLSLRYLKPGEMMAFGVAFEPQHVHKINIGAVKTTHPKTGMRFDTKIEPPTDKIKKTLQKLSNLPQEQEIKLKTENELKGEINRLNIELRKKPKSEVDGRQVEVMQKRMELAQVDSFNKGLRAEASNHKAQTDHYEKTFQIFENRIKSIANELKQFTIKCSKLLQIELPKILPNVPEKIKVDYSYGKKEIKGVYPEPKKDDIRPIGAQPIPLEDGELTAAQKKILEALAKFKPVLEDVPRPMVAAYSGVSSRSSGYRANISKLSTIGYIKYRVPGKIYLTEEGESLVETTQSPATTDQLQEMWMGLLSESRQNILKVLIEVYPNNISREELAERAGSSFSSSGYRANISAMSSMCILEYPEHGMICASKNVFIE